MVKHEIFLKAAPAGRAGRRIVTALAATAAVAVCSVIWWRSPVHAQDGWTASSALSVQKSWIIDGNLNNELGAASRIDYVMQAFSLGIVSRPDAEGLEDQALAVGKFHRSKPAAVIALRAHTARDHGPVALALQAAPAPGRPCIDRVEGMMPLAMQAGEVTHVDFTCMAADGGSTVRGECKAILDDGIRLGSGIDFATPMHFANEPQARMLICRLTP